MRKIAMSSCAALLALFAAAGAAQAQDGVSPERHTGPKDVPFLQGDATIFDFNVRFTDLNGEIGNVGSSWSDLYNSGIGASLDFVFLNEVDSGFHIGPYFEVGADLFAADEAPSLGGIALTDADDLMLGRGMAGVAVRATIGPIFLEARGGGGAIYYTATEVETTPGVSTEIFEGSVHFGWEARGTFGAMISDSVSLTISFGYESKDGPNGSDEAPGFEPRNLKSFVLSFGLSFQL
jgi:hypothetical protein